MKLVIAAVGGLLLCSLAHAQKPESKPDMDKLLDKLTFTKDKSSLPYRLLKPDGLFLAAMIGGDSLAELRDAFAQAEAEVEGGVSPRVAPFADLRDLVDRQLTWPTPRSAACRYRRRSPRPSGHKAPRFRSRPPGRVRSATSCEPRSRPPGNRSSSPRLRSSGRRTEQTCGSPLQCPSRSRGPRNRN